MGNFFDLTDITYFEFSNYITFVTIPFILQNHVSFQNIKSFIGYNQSGQDVMHIIIS